MKKKLASKNIFDAEYNRFLSSYIIWLLVIFGLANNPNICIDVTAAAGKSLSLTGLMN